MRSFRFTHLENDERPTVSFECDCEQREAEVSICCNAAFAIDSPTSPIHQWSLMFEFVDGAVRVVKGIRYDESLLPSVIKVRDPSAKIYEKIGTVIISPTKIRHLALSNPYNNKPYSYEYLKCNSQSWVNEILKELSFQKKEPVVVESGRYLIAVATVVTAFIGILLIKGIIKR